MLRLSFANSDARQFPGQVHEKLRVPSAEVVQQFRRRIAVCKRRPSTNLDLLLREIRVLKFLPCDERLGRIGIKPLQRRPVLFAALVGLGRFFFFGLLGAFLLWRCGGFCVDLFLVFFWFVGLGGALVWFLVLGFRLLFHLDLQLGR